ncbi:hypothetical protein [Marmoricola endophyticus]|uniref:hypothetical protein n=1 Tax=Marmoricola endophyticus TaxID=2040280 RepID=UPI00402B70B6
MRRGSGPSDVRCPAPRSGSPRTASCCSAARRCSRATGTTPRARPRRSTVGEIDEDGFVRVTGRRQEIIVTAGGKSVSPTALEERLRSHPLVDQCLVVGDGRPVVGALLTLDPDALAAWCESRGRSGERVEDLLDDPDLRADLQRGVDDANRSVSRAEAVRRFAVLPVLWTEEGGQLTPSLKLRRSVLMRETLDDVSRMYDR